jgi:hypothetical protein
VGFGRSDNLQSVRDRFAEPVYEALSQISTTATNHLNALYANKEAKLCPTIKNQIDPNTGKPMDTIYANQVNTSSPPDATSTMVSNCASNSDKFFMLTRSSRVAGVSNQIGTQLSQLRVSRQLTQTARPTKKPG